MSIKPLGNRLLIKRLSSSTSKGGILLPDSAQEKPRQGEVVSVGPGRVDDKGQTHPMEVKVGDQILFSSYAGTQVETDEKDVEYLIMAEDDILGILEENV